MVIDRLIKIGFCFSVLVLSAFVQIPLFGYDYPVLFISCFLLTLVFEKNYALVAVLTYLVAGVIGFPIFTYGGGFSYIHEASFGHLLSLIPLALFAFFWKHVSLREYGWAFLKNLSVAAIPVAHLFGFLYLFATHNLNFENFMGLSLYPMLYDIVFASLLVIMLPETKSYENL